MSNQAEPDQVNAFLMIYGLVVQGPWWHGVVLACVVAVNHVIATKFDRDTLHKVAPTILVLMALAGASIWLGQLGRIVVLAFLGLGTLASGVTVVIDPFSSGVLKLAQFVVISSLLLGAAYLLSSKGF